MSNDEYSLLRTEILQCSQVLDNARNILYTAVGAILAFAFTQNDPLIFVIPYVVIIPTYLLTLETVYSIYRIGAYLLVFHEGTEYNWESRLFKLYDVLKPKKTLRYSFTLHVPFISVGFICTLLSLFFLFTNDSEITIFDFAFRCGLPIVLLFSILAIAYIHRESSNAKSMFVKQWEDVKAAEPIVLEDAAE